MSCWQTFFVCAQEFLKSIFIKIKIYMQRKQLCDAPPPPPHSVWWWYCCVCDSHLYILQFASASVCARYKIKASHFVHTKTKQFPRAIFICEYICGEHQRVLYMCNAGFKTEFDDDNLKKRARTLEEVHMMMCAIFTCIYSFKYV